MDAFAEQAATFTRHYVQWPVCGPSRASMLGGLRPDSTGLYEIGDSWQIAKRPETHPTLPLYFKNHGYTTLSYGKVYHGAGKGMGYGWSEDPWKLDWTCYVNFEDPKEKKGWRPAYEIYDGADSLHNDYQTADRVIEAMKKHKNEPFLIAGGFYKPHLPFVAPKAYWNLYSPEQVERIEPETLPSGAADYMYNWTEIKAYGDPRGKSLYESDADVGDDQARRMIHAYYACVSFIDAQIGRILEALEAEGLAGNTAVVIWGDHGFHLGDQGRWAKHTQFEGAMRSPLMIRLPGQQKISGATKALAESIDIYPTLCEFAGLPVPDFVEGKSLVPVLMGASGGKEAAYSQIRPVGGPNKARPMAYTVRTQDYRYVEWRSPDGGNAIIKQELYDLENSTNETENLAGRGEMEEVVEKHQSLLAEVHLFE
jgi:iduronate 2-sulfatase